MPPTIPTPPDARPFAVALSLPPSQAPPPGASSDADTDGVDWPAFRDWLLEVRGVGRRTASTVASQVRRVLRDASESADGGEPRVTRESLLRWHASKPDHQRTPVVSAWRRYRDWWESKGVSGLPDFPRRQPRSAGTPTTVVAALVALADAGISVPEIQGMRWDPVEEGDPLYTALVTSSPRLRSGELRALRGASGITLAPRTAIQAIIVWAHAGVPEKGAPVVPVEPGSVDAMPVTRIRRLIRNHRKKDQ